MMDVDSRPEPPLAKAIRQQRAEARAACDALAEVADAFDIELPELGVDRSELFTGEVLVDVGRMRVESVRLLAEHLQLLNQHWDTIAAAVAEPVTPAVPLFRPNVGDLVVDTATGRAGEFRGEDGDTWCLAAVSGDSEPWTADPLTVRTATVNELVRVGMTARINRQPKAG
ncbi:hypothetical protein ACFYS8_19460 [Kitasatospora sp. NPDC004615]|uniref:hypothetical protein n=1 Tax=Kitasatospora sp. NPDC004615 TaxID=3364017 RepID=UPI00368C3770